MLASFCVYLLCVYVHGIKLSESRVLAGEADGYNFSERLQEGEAGGTAQLNYTNKHPIDAGPLAKNRSSSSGLDCFVCMSIKEVG